jgi:hypothetical protein
MVGVHPLRRELLRRCRSEDDPFGADGLMAALHVEGANIRQLPAALGRGGAGATDDLDEVVFLAVVDGDIEQHRGGAAAAHVAGVDQVVPGPDPDLAGVDCVGRQWLILDRLPAVELGVRADEHPLVEGEVEHCHQHAGEDGGCQDLVGADACRLEDHHLAVLVQRHEGEQRGQQHREWQEQGDELRQAQQHIVPELGLAIPCHRQDLSRFAEKIQRLQDEDQPAEEGDGADEEHPRRVAGDGRRREHRGEQRKAHQAAAFFRRKRRKTDIRIAKPRSSPPIGWPPGRCAST